MIENNIRILNFLDSDDPNEPLIKRPRSIQGGIQIEPDVSSMFSKTTNI